MLGDGLILGRNVLHSTVQYTIKRAVIDGSCPFVPINVSILCRASLESVLIVGGRGKGILVEWT